MSESFVTQCPHCQTRFRVTRAQLGMARGSVRCGACLQVFNAAEQLAGELQQATDMPLSAAGQPAPGNAATGAAVAAGAATLAAGNLPAGHAETWNAATPAVPATPAMADTPASAEPPQAAAAAQPPMQAPLDDDSPWIDDDLDLDDLDLEFDLDEELDALTSGSPLLAAAAPSHPAPLEDPLQAPAAAHDESWVEALLNDQQPTTEHTAIRAEPSLDDTPALDDEEDPEFIDDAEDAARHAPGGLSTERDEPISIGAAAASLAAGAAAASTRRSEPRLRDEGLLNLSDEPLQLDWQPQQQPGWARRLMWALLILLALAGLAGQYAWLHLDELARDGRVRPWLERACPLLGCQLPPLVDVSLVKSSNLVVRNHPTHPGALTVDAIIYNRADFAQPFPLLELRFEDINGQPLASRRFTPGEYLAGELAGRRDMPPQTPIRIALEIVDPGTRAVNYSIGFHSPD